MGNVVVPKVTLMIRLTQSVRCATIVVKLALVVRLLNVLVVRLQENIITGHANVLMECMIIIIIKLVKPVRIIV